MLRALWPPCARGSARRRVALYPLSSDGERLELEAENDGGAHADRPDACRRPRVVGGVVQTGQLVAVEDPASDPRFEVEVDTPDDGLARPTICVPIKLRDKVVGVLRVFLAEGGRRLAATAEVLGAAFSAAVRNVLLYRSLLQSIEEVAEARQRARG